jgi:hypothetical protein
MAKMVLMYQNTVLKEVLFGQRGVRIGRSPDNDLVIDNTAVSHHHARAFVGTEGHWLLEDIGSLNGTFVNGQRIKRVTLRPGDTVAIGKHRILIEETPEFDGFLSWRPPAKPDAPKVQETSILATRERIEFLQKLAAEGETSQVAPERMKVPTLTVRKGKTDQQVYTLTDKLTVIGRSALATVKLRAWFAPKVAAQINRREDSYYIGAAAKAPTVNGHQSERPIRLVPGDIIEVAGIQFEFDYRE